MELVESKPSPSEAHPDTMDFLSREWCNFALQSLQPDQSIVLLDNSFAKFQGDASPVSCAKMVKSMKIDESDFKSSIPPWKTNDVKSWIWMQQAMHPELNYNGYFRKKFKLPWMIGTLRAASFKKWWKEIKAKRKEEERVQKAEVHAAVSVAGLAAALAAIAAENSEKGVGATKELAVASAAAIVAMQCAQVAKAMGANKDQLSTIVGSATAATSVSEILTLTAAATTSLRGASTLKARTGCKKNRLKGSAPVLPIADSCDLQIEFEKNRSTLSKGIHLPIETPDGDFKLRSVSIVLSSEGKVILKLKKLNLLKSKKECVVMNLHVELYKDSESEDIEDTCYLIVLRTNRGTCKLDMADDYNLYKTWVATINHMLTLSASIPTTYHLQFSKN